MTRLPIAHWLETLEEMAAQTAGWLEQVEQALHQPVQSNETGHTPAADKGAPVPHQVPEGANPKAGDDKVQACRRMSAAQSCLPPEPEWQALLEPVEQSVQSADRGAETVQHRCQQWQERYAAWQQLLEQSLKALLSRSPPP